MANVISTKIVKIKPENEAIAQGVVTRCKYAGAFKTGIGFVTKTTYLYKVFVKVEGLEKPLVLKVKEKQGWNMNAIDEMKSAVRMFGGKKPISEGEALTVAYDRLKPKKCNVVE